MGTMQRSIFRRSLASALASKVMSDAPYLAKVSERAEGAHSEGREHILIGGGVTFLSGIVGGAFEHIRLVGSAPLLDDIHVGGADGLGKAVRWEAVWPAEMMVCDVARADDER